MRIWLAHLLKSPASQDAMKPLPQKVGRVMNVLPRIAVWAAVIGAVLGLLTINIVAAAWPS